MGENNGLNQLGELHNAVHIIKNAILNSQERALGLINQEQLALYYGIMVGESYAHKCRYREIRTYIKMNDG